MISAASSSSTMSLVSRNLSHYGRASYSANRLLDASQRQSSQPTTISSRRYLFSEEVLGVDRFLDVRTKINSQFGKHKEKFYDRFEEHLKGEKSSILSEDLKNLIFLCDKAPKEVDLLKQAIAIFEKQNESLRFGNFQFGPIVMRMAYHLNLPEFAMMLMEKEYINFFSQLSSVTIALDLLFKNERYEDVVKVFNFVTENYKFDTKYPSDFVTLYLASCYKINTLEAFDQSYRLLRSVKASTNVVKSRGMGSFLALAVNQKQPNIALEIIQTLSVKSYSTIIQSIRVQAFAEIERFHDAFDILRYQLKKDKAVTRYKAVHQETLNKIEKLISESSKKDLLPEFQLLVKNLSESNLVETEKTLEQAILLPIEVVSPKSGQRKQQHQKQILPIQRTKQSAKVAAN
ncbi:regulation of mRNA processing [Tyrophagus putrescentiae]|nr:regulation of mRNA processing [Tyrophagus putrescentiae]